MFSFRESADCLLNNVYVIDGKSTITYLYWPNEKKPNFVMNANWPTLLNWEQIISKPEDQLSIA